MSVQIEKKQKYDSKPNICKQCNGDIPYERRYRKFCSDICKIESTKHIERIIDRKKQCLNCYKTIFSKGLTKVRFERTKCCSRECLYEYFRKSAPDKKPRIVTKCKFCNKEYETIKDSNRKKIYCSNECFKKGHKGSFKLSEEHKKRISETRRRDWASGEVYKYQNNYYCKWYEFTKKNGEVIKVQGTWELKYVEWLEDNNIKYLAHEGCLYYKDSNGKDRVYLPDFYLIDTKEYIDVKSRYIFNLRKDKFDCIRKHNPEVKVTVLFEEDLRELGIKL